MLAPAIRPSVRNGPMAFLQPKSLPQYRFRFEIFIDRSGAFPAPD
jgi:hypothetical protein